MQYPGTDTGSSNPHWGEQEQTMFVHVPLMTGTMPSQSPGILAYEGNPSSYIQVDGSNSMSSVLTG